MSRQKKKVLQESRATGRKTLRERLGLNYTVMLVPHSGKAPSKLRLPAGVFAAAFFAVFALLCCTTAFAVESWRMQSVAAENAGLKKITTEQEQQLTDLEELAQELTEVAQQTGKQTDEIREIVGLDPSELNIPDAKGGPYVPAFQGAQVGDSDVTVRLEQLSETLCALQDYYEDLSEQTEGLQEEAQEWKALSDGMPDAWPLDSFSISSGFGTRVDPFTYDISSHSGLDLVADYGTPVYAAGGGIVTASEFSSAGYGNYIILEHANGYESLYGHCSELYVSVGEVVEKGQLIARVGASGRATGSHLHFEIRVDGQQVNPLAILE